MYHNLPPQVFVSYRGRDDIRREIAQRLAPTAQQHLVVLAGVTGIGKSALAMAIARHYVDDYHQLAEDERFRAVVWVPVIAQQRPPYRPFGRLVASPALYGFYVALSGVLTKVTGEADPWAILRAAPAEQPRVAQQKLAELGRVLLIVDDFDATDDVDLRTFLMERLPSSCKAILTVRLPEDLPRPIHLPPLDAATLTTILHTEMPRYDEREGGSLSTIRGVTPFTMQLAAGLCAQGGIEVVNQWKGHAAGTAGFVDLIEGILKHLKGTAPSSYYTLLALTFFSRVAGATSEQLSAAAGVSLADCEMCLEQLAAMRLVVPTSSGGYVIAHTSIWAAMRAALRDKAGDKAGDDQDKETDEEKEWEARARIRWIVDHDRAVRELTHEGAPLRSDAERALVENVLTVMEWLRDQDNMIGLASFFRQTQDLLYDWSLWDHLLAFADELSIWAEQEHNSEIVMLPLDTALDVCLRLRLIQHGALWLKRASTVASHRHQRVLDETIARARMRFAANDRVTS